MLVATVAIAAIFAAGVAGWQITRGDEATSPTEGATWESIAVTDRITGDVTYLDPDGEVIAESPGNGRAGSAHGVDGTLTLVSNQRIVVLGGPGSSDEPLVIEAPPTATVSEVSTIGARFLAVGRSTGGDVIVIEPATQTVFDIGALVSDTLASTPLMFAETLRFNADGSMFAIADATNFQTIVVRRTEPAPVFLPDQPLAVGERLVATTQTVGLQADVALVALDRSTAASVPTEIPAGGVFDDEQRLVMVSTGGGVFRIASGDEEPDLLGRVSTPVGQNVVWARPAHGGDRLVLAGRAFEAVIDLDGNTLFSHTFPADVDVVAPEPRWTCLPVGGTGSAHSIVDLDTGEQLADLTGAVIVDVADNGCTVLADRAGVFELIAPGGTVALGTAESILLAPDGRAVVRTTGGITELLLVDDDLHITRTVDITSHAVNNSVITFIAARVD